MMEKQINQTKVAYDKAFDTLGVFTKNFATVERESLKIAKIIYKNKEDIQGTTIDHWNINGFKFVGFSATEDGRPIISVHMGGQMKNEIPSIYVSCKNCYNSAQIKGDVAEMFGIAVDVFTKNELETCPECSSGYKFLKRNR